MNRLIISLLRCGDVDFWPKDVEPYEPFNIWLSLPGYNIPARFAPFAANAPRVCSVLPFPLNFCEWVVKLLPNLILHYIDNQSVVKYIVKHWSKWRKTNGGHFGPS